MVACPNCTAKFSSAAEAELRWLETHLARFHEVYHARASRASLDDKRAA